MLVLPDMNIDLDIKTLMKFICILISCANFSDDDFKKDIIFCESIVLERFFKGDELLEMSDMLRCEDENPEIARIIEKYGKGMDVIYFDGKADGFIEGEAKGEAKGEARGRANEKVELARNLLAEGIDEEIISRCIGLSLNQIRQIKRNI